MAKVAFSLAELRGGEPVGRHLLHRQIGLAAEPRQRSGRGSLAGGQRSLVRRELVLRIVVLLAGYRIASDQGGIAIEGHPIGIDDSLLRRGLVQGGYIVRLQRPELQGGLPKIGLRLVHSELESRRLQPEQLLALGDVLTLMHQDLIDEAGNVGGYAQDVALD